MENEKREALQIFKDALRIVTPETQIMGVQFIGINGYENRHGEISNYVINGGIPHAAIDAKDLQKYRNLLLNPGRYGFLVEKYGQKTVLEAFDELIKGIETSFDGTNKRSIAQKVAYVRISPAMKVCIATRDIMLFGQKVSKKTLVEGIYPVVKSRPKTLCKAEIKRLAGIKGDDYRQFILSINNLSVVSIGGKRADFRYLKSA